MCLAHGTDDFWLQLHGAWHSHRAGNHVLLTANVTVAKTQLAWQQLQLVSSLGDVSQSTETLHISALRLQPAEPLSWLQALFPCCFSPEK